MEKLSSKLSSLRNILFSVHFKSKSPLYKYLPNQINYSMIMLNWRMNGQ